jgi:hypothetical protein
MLREIRICLGHKALLFRNKVRYSTNVKGKTRAWKDITKITREVMMHVRCYLRAREALDRLGASQDILDKYKDIKKADLKMSQDVVEENRFGQRNDILAWFWRLGPHSDTDGDEAMQECELFS